MERFQLPSFEVMDNMILEGHKSMKLDLVKNQLRGRFNYADNYMKQSSESELAQVGFSADAERTPPRPCTN